MERRLGIPPLSCTLLESKIKGPKLRKEKQGENVEARIKRERETFGGAKEEREEERERRGI